MIDVKGFSDNVYGSFTSDDFLTWVYSSLGYYLITGFSFGFLNKGSALDLISGFLTTFGGAFFSIGFS